MYTFEQTHPQAHTYAHTYTHTHITHSQWQFVLQCLICDVMTLKLKDNIISTGSHFCVISE